MRQSQLEIWSIMGEILQDDLLELAVESYDLQEDMHEAMCRIALTATNVTTGQAMSIEGRGVGLVDAVFAGLKSRLSNEFPSLNSLSISRFEMKGLIGSGPRSNSDAEVRAELALKNSYGIEFAFECLSRSVGHAAIQATVNAIEYFVNSERTFVRLFKARKHYEAENRVELVDKYTALMASMVNNTSYSEVIDQIKVEM